MSLPVSESTPPPAKKVRFRAPKAAVLTATAALAAGLACPTVKVRPDDDLAWLASCPARSRDVVRILHLNPGSPNDEGPAWAELEPGQNVKVPSAGCEVKEGPVEVRTVMDPGNASGTLIGSIIIGADRAHFRFHELDLPDGRKFPICAIGAESFLQWGPGVPMVDENAPGRPPASELHPGYLYITTGRLRIRLAPYLGNQTGQDPKVN